MKRIRITVGFGSCGKASGAEIIYNELKKIIAEKQLDITLVPVGCIGVCAYEPLIEVYVNKKRFTYANVKVNNVNDIINDAIKGIPSELAIKTKNNNILNDNFIKRQTRIALKNCGEINPEDINEYISVGGYDAMKKAFSLKQADIINILKKSMLRGRGGAGFLTGAKWESAFNSLSDNKYVICNADEGDPGAFMDRAVLEGNPHAIIEAMIIAMYTIGANKSYIYVRNEYPLAVKRIELAINQAKEKGFLNDKYDIEIKLGAGAFVCGEETALMSSIEGLRGEPKNKPPYPTTSGVKQKPTLINNVETLANIPQIIINGYKWFNKFGTKKSSGTKVFALGGKINNTGLVEVPIGTKLREIIYDIGGGIPNQKEFKAAQTGGPSGGCIPKDLIDTNMDYEELNSIGSMMGSGGLIVMDEDNCMVDIAKYFLDFTVYESCGKCTPCRIGTKQLHNLLTKFADGIATETDLEKLEELARHIKKTSFCGLGSSAPNPVLSTLKYFKIEYEEHIKKTCTAKVCTKLITYEIDKEKCVGCSMCKNACPVNAIKGELKQPHEIDEMMCFKCGTCYNTCKINAIKKI